MISLNLLYNSQSSIQVSRETLELSNLDSWSRVTISLWNGNPTASTSPWLSLQFSDCPLLWWTVVLLLRPSPEEARWRNCSVMHNRIAKHTIFGRRGNKHMFIALRAPLWVRAQRKILPYLLAATIRTRNAFFCPGNHLWRRKERGTGKDPPCGVRLCKLIWSIVNMSFVFLLFRLPLRVVPGVVYMGRYVWVCIRDIQREILMFCQISNRNREWWKCLWQSFHK